MQVRHDDGGPRFQLTHDCDGFGADNTHDSDAVLLTGAERRCSLQPEIHSEPWVVLPSKCLSW